MYVKNHIFPIDTLDEIKEAFVDTGKKIRVRYRGPRYGVSDTLRCNAYGFVVYNQRKPSVTARKRFSAKREFPLQGR